MTQFTVISPCFNASERVIDTVKSIVTQTALQSGRATLQYVVVDGGSTDDTVKLLNEVLADFSFGSVQIISEQDHGMYDALAKGLSLTSGHICSYLNMGDLYSPYAFDVVLDVLENNPVEWLTGLQVVLNEKGQIVSSNLHFPYRSRLFECGLYDNISLPYLQQESTFWISKLNQQVDLARLRTFKYAGDFYLWHCFSQCCNLTVVQSHLGGFRLHKGQLSENNKAYTAELRSVVRQPTVIDRLLGLWDKTLLFAASSLRRRLYPRHLVTYDHHAGQWR